ncbi:MAG TPA: histidine phosphatase family protein [Actinomycetota bacterium]|nr:histidine phosphatase family protein [Actinomycetota bacterium]
MRRLILLRHAKSSWDDPDLADVDRPLSARGRTAARAMAAHLRAHPVHPDLILCSPSARTRETLALVAPSLGSVETRFDEALYTFDAGAALDHLVATLDDDRVCALVVGHNPPMGELAGTLASEGDALGAVRAKFPTGALAELELAIESWSALRPGCGRLTTFVRPRDLT